jgi:iron-sulfur cluster repair protein YtfE (RIC family)
VEYPTTEMTLNEITGRWPETLEILARYGLDTCCGGARPLQESAGKHGVEPETLIRELRDALVRPPVR